MDRVTRGMRRGASERGFSLFLCHTHTHTRTHHHHQYRSASVWVRRCRSPLWGFERVEAFVTKGLTVVVNLTVFLLGF